MEAVNRQARSNQRKAQRERVYQLEQEIQRLESQQTELVAELEKEETYQKPGRANEINRELIIVQERLAELNPQWEQQATKLEALD